MNRLNDFFRGPNRMARQRFHKTKDEPDRFAVYNPSIEAVTTSLRRRGFVVPQDAFEGHRKIRAALQAHGFVVWKIECVPFHRSYAIFMFRGAATGADTRAGIARHIRKVVRNLVPGFRISEVTVSVSGDRIIAAFSCPGGVAGTLYISPKHRTRVLRSDRSGPPASRDRFRR